MDLSADEPAAQDADADRIEFKNLAAEAIGQLEAGDADRATIAGMRQHVDDLLDDEEFWTLLGSSLALFVTPEGVRTFPAQPADEHGRGL